MELIRRDIVAVLQDLPEFCFSRLPTTGEPIIIRRGHVGYYPTHPARDVEKLNGHMEITAAQVTAMELGSHFGFQVPGADPLNHQELAEASDYNAALRLKGQTCASPAMMVD